MEEEDDDDIYAPEEGITATASAPKTQLKSPEQNNGGEANQDGEEGEEMEEAESDSDIDIITERKAAPEPKVESAQAPRAREIKAQSTSTPAAEPSPTRRDSHAIKIEAPRKESKETPSGRPGSSYPALKTSTVDVDAKPIYKPIGKTITDMDMDADFPEDDKPWRKPGTDMTDYFNYGFDEFTWASYCLKQQTLRKEVVDSKKQMEEMQNFLSSGMPAMPGGPGAPAPAVAPGMPPIGGPNDVPPEMQQMFQQMMAQGMDPMSMGPEQMMQMMQGGGGMGESNQGFGGQNFGQQGQGGHQMGYGGGFGGGGGGGGGGGNQGRGRGRRW